MSRYNDNNRLNKLKKRHKYSSPFWLSAIIFTPLFYIQYMAEYKKDGEMSIDFFIAIYTGIYILLAFLCKTVKIHDDEVSVVCLFGLHKIIFIKDDVISVQMEEAGRCFKYLVIRDRFGRLTKIHPGTVRHFEELSERLGEWFASRKKMCKK